MLHTSWRALLVVLLVFAGQRALAETPPSASSEEVTLSIWSARFSNALDRELRYPAPIRGDWRTGVVYVKFHCSESGAPADVAIYKSSGAHVLDAAAIRAVKNIATLHPLPGGMKNDQAFRAVVLFSSSQEEHDRQLAQLSKEALHANQWFGKSQSDQMASAIYLIPAPLR